VLEVTAERRAKQLDGPRLGNFEATEAVEVTEELTEGYGVGGAHHRGNLNSMAAPFVHGHEKIPMCGHVDVPARGQVKVPIPL
jgi:hypothetical protein